MKGVMKNFSSKQYLKVCLSHLGMFAICFLCVLAVSCMGENPNPALGAAMAGALGGIIFGLPCIGYAVAGIVNNKKSKTLPRQEGEIVNWARGFWKNMGNVIVKIDDKEYSTPSYFFGEEARELVGSKISFCLIEDTVYIFEVL